MLMPKVSKLVITICLLFPVFNRKTIFSRNLHISCVYYLLSQRFLYLMTVKLPKVRNNLPEEINPKWDYIVSKSALSTNFHGNRKEE